MTKGDKLLIILVIILSFTSMGYIRKQGLSNKDKYVSIQVNGKEVKKIIFDDKVIGKTIPLETEYGYNLIEIGNNEIRVIDADCPDKIDVKQGSISRIGETIVCLPNKMVIEIKGLETVDGIDMINY
ncbi:MAG: NusG domain II-containing protein [Tissierellaceae bacterium]|nr:NusG domain II-containing protein [Tissierellaceae bacterium]